MVLHRRELYRPDARQPAWAEVCGRDIPLPLEERPELRQTLEQLKHIGIAGIHCFDFTHDDRFTSPAGWEVEFTMRGDADRRIIYTSRTGLTARDD